MGLEALGALVAVQQRDKAGIDHTGWKLYRSTPVLCIEFIIMGSSGLCVGSFRQRAEVKSVGHCSLSQDVLHAVYKGLLGWV